MGITHSHSGVSVAEVLKSAVVEWELQRVYHGIDAVKEAMPPPHIKCFAHILNLANQTGLNVPAPQPLLSSQLNRHCWKIHQTS